MRGYALILFIAIASPNQGLAEETIYHLPEEILNELWWEVTAIENARDQTCLELGSEAEFQEAIDAVDDHIGLIIEEHEAVQDRILQIQRMCMLAPRHYPDNEEVAFAAEELFHSSNTAMLLVDSLVIGLERERVMVYYLHQPLPGFSEFPLELGFLCDNAHNYLIDTVKQTTYELFQTVAPYT